MDCILVLFTFLWIINVQFRNDGFLNFWFFVVCFKISQIGLFWSKITIFIIEISLKQHLHTKYWWNNPNSRRLGLKSQKRNFLLFLAAPKFIAHTNIQIHVTGLIFIIHWFFLNAPNDVLYQNQWQLKLPKYAYLLQYGPLKIL